MLKSVSACGSLATNTRVPPYLKSLGRVQGTPQSQLQDVALFKSKGGENEHLIVHAQRVAGSAHYGGCHFRDIQLQKKPLRVAQHLECL